MLVGKALKIFDSKDIFNHWHRYTQQTTKWGFHLRNFREAARQKMKLNKKYSGWNSVKFSNGNQYYTEQRSSKGSGEKTLLRGSFETE